MTEEEIISLAYDCNCMPEACTDKSLFAFAQSVEQLTIEKYKTALEQQKKAVVGFSKALQKTISERDAALDELEVIKKQEPVAVYRFSMEFSEYEIRRSNEHAI